ncbi:MAG: rod shape-determining protein MreC [Alphaproteobacteria bacterium]|nr:rod shape-determining protein MreC [Alphaproteobacteria bacterium]
MALFLRYKKPGPLKPTPNPYPSRFQFWRHSLLASFLIILIGGGVLRFYKPFYDPLQDGLFEGVAWLQKGFLQPFHETSSLLKDTHQFIYLKDEYERLKLENETLHKEIQVLRPLAHENSALRKILNVPSVDGVKYQGARVLSTPYDGLHRFFLIEGGQKNDLIKDQAVIVEEGVVGRLEKVGAHVARVLLITDLNSRVPVVTSLSNEKAILSGNGDFLPTLVYVNDVKKIQIGEQIITSGLGGVFPPGFPVGVVETIENGKIKVRPYAPFQKIEWVQILKIHPENFYKEINTALEGE